MTRDELKLLMDRLLPRIENYGEKDKCWPWTGKKTTASTRIRHKFVYGMPVSMYTSIDKPYGEIMDKGKYLRVNRIVYEFLVPAVAELPLPWRLVNTCDNTLCCNPEHWECVMQGQSASRPKKDKKDEAPPDEEELLRRDCEDLLDQIFMVGGPSTLDEVLNHVYMIDFNRELVIKTLHKMGKGYLCNE
ncbi:hypothetical protein PJWF_00074 [Achromobacter phage JWF]|uniref:hypothetical protein n=1 Tax=Achromobacter phage JWF TaxID=1589748 RepID=UPI000588E50A|nr:hypothetical protein AXJ13_gp114 [Achromobacter phage JWF]AJD82967.1 hypothetical protein PJWF_00074 [Achromobacter phage JWF]